MGNITDSIASAFRDFVTDGVASSGPHEPIKADIRALGPLIETAIGNAALGALVSVTKTTKALLDADLEHAADTVALVYADATDANNDLYVKTGASGAGGWTLTSVLHAAVAALFADPLQQAQAWAEDAAESAAQCQMALPTALGTADLLVQPGMQNGATFDAATYTITIPAGQTGNNSTTLTRWVLNNGAVIPAAWTGRQLRIRIAFTQSATFTRTWGGSTFQVKVGPSIGGTNTTRSVTPTVTTSGVWRYYDYLYTLQGDESEIRPYVQLVAASGAATTETVQFVAYEPYVIASENTYETALDFTARTREAALLASAKATSEAKYLLRVKDVLGTSDLTVAFNPLNGATFSGVTRTLTIPTGQTGNNSTTLTRWILNGGAICGAALAGRKIRIRIAFTQSATFTRTWDTPSFEVRAGPTIGGSTVVRETALTTVTTSGNRRVYEYDYVLQGDESEIRPTCKILGASPTASDETVTLTAYVPSILTSEDPDQTGLEAALDSQLDQRELTATQRAIYYSGGMLAGTRNEIITVAPSGGDYTDPNDAIAAANALNPSAINRVKIDIRPGTYDIGAEMQPGDFVDLIGAGAWQTLIRFFRDDSATGVQIDTDSVLRMQRTHRVEGLGIWGRNVRYAVHPEIPISGSLAVNAVTEIIGCDVRHFGNPSPNNYRAQAAQNAIGSGTSSGNIVRVKGSYLWAEYGAGFAIHNNTSYAEPCLIEVEGNTIIAGSVSGNAISLVSYGSGRADRFVYNGNTLFGDVVQAILSGGDTREIDVTAFGNSPHRIVNAAAYRPRIADEERVVKNNTASSIPTGTVLAYDGAIDVVRPMTSADSASLFAGVVWGGAIAAGAKGRAKSGGWIALADVLRTDAASLVFGDTFSIDAATPGSITKGGSQGLLPLVRTNTLKVG